MTTFMKHSNDQSHVGSISRGSAKIDPYTKAALKFDDANQIQKNIKRTSAAIKILCTGQGKQLTKFIYDTPDPFTNMTELEKEYCKRDVANTLKCFDNLLMKQRLNDSVNKEISRQFGKDGRRK